MKPIRWRLIFVILLTLIASYTVAPTVLYFLQPAQLRNNEDEFQKKLPSWLSKNHIKLGLDLQGGVQLVLGVNTESTIENRLSRMAADIDRWAKEQKIDVGSTYAVKGTQRLVLNLGAKEDPGAFNEKLIKEFPLLTKIDRKELELSYSYKESEIERIRKGALEQAERVVRSRVDQWGVTEPMINRRADGSILVQLPGFSDPQKAKELLGRTAQLKFKIVDDEFKGFNGLKDKLPTGVTSDDHGQTAFSSESREDLIAFLKDHVPQDHELLFTRKQLGDSKAKYRWTSYVVFAATELTGDDILDANIGQGSDLDRKPAVMLKFTSLGGKRLAELTTKHVKKRMAIVLDDVVESAPTIRQKIPNGNAQIDLGGSGRSYNEVVDEGTQLALILKAGAIPATIKVLEERQVGASLGPELANQGIMGALVGFFCVLLFMVVYYRRPGAIACLALSLNGLFLLAIMAVFGFALTLPGIAGFVLTLGMAVDANVLINERIRQEIKEGKHPRKAVEAGFSKVFWTIIDSHVTTLIAAFVLLETNSSGPIRGFAVTLIIGLLVSLFTSLTCTRLIFDIALRNISDKRIKSWLAGAEIKMRVLKFNFMSIAGTVTAGFIIMALAVVGTSMIKGVNLGVDFAGGTEVIMSFSQDVEPQAIRDIAEKNHIEGLSLQALEGGKKSYLIRYDDRSAEAAVENKDSSSMASDTFVAFKAALLNDLKDSGPEIQQVGFVGPQVGKELRNQGIISVLYAMLAILLYVAFRFDMRFAPGAITKMFFDVFVILGFYVFGWQSFDLVAVAVFLTVVGYSVNDTIVIYDRIRENMTEHPGRAVLDNLNISLNETLSRSINTSLVTALSLVGILIFGTGQIWTFAMAMLIGIVSATLTSTFISSSCVLWMERWKKMKTEKAVYKNTAAT